MKRGRPLHRPPSPARSQLVLLGLVFAGAVVLALAAALLRPILFEPFIRERPPGTPEQIEAWSRRFTSGAADDEEWRALLPETLDALWWICVGEGAEGGEEGWIRELLSRHPEATIQRARRTLVVGSAEQRYRASEVLALAGGTASRGRAMQLCVFALERARNRGEHDFVRHLEGVLDSLQKTE